jgi:hypothetical protein
VKLKDSQLEIVEVETINSSSGKEMETRVPVTG